MGCDCINDKNPYMRPLFRPYVPDSLPNLESILHSGQLAYGKFSTEFERDLEEYIGIEKVVCTNSYNSAYLVLITALNLQPGDEVIASPMCCLASSQPFAISGIKLIWADIDPAIGTLDPDSVRESITPKTKAIVHNHFCGYVGFVNDIRSIANEKGILLIDDVSEAFGSEYKGFKAGNWGADATVYSFQTVRLPNSIDGGGISFKYRQHTEKALLLRDYGIDRTRFRDDIGEISSGCDIKLAAYGVLPSDVNSYIGSLTLRQTDNLLGLQRKNAMFWEEVVPQQFATPLKPLNNTIPNYWVFGTLAENKRDFIELMRRRYNYYASSVHLPNNYYSLFGNQCELPGVTEFQNHFVALPSGWWIDKVEMK